MTATTTTTTTTATATGAGPGAEPLAHQLSIKLPFADGAAIAPREAVPVFHRWIQDRALDHPVLLDVADYTHVHDGPGVLLICHGAFYGVNEAGGRPGLVYAARRDEPGALSAKLADALRRAVTAAALLEAAPELGGRARVRADRLIVRVHSRIVAPSTPETFEAALPVVTRALAPLVGEPVTVAPIADRRELLTLDITAPAAPPLAELARRLS